MKHLAAIFIVMTISCGTDYSQQELEDLANFEESTEAPIETETPEDPELNSTSALTWKNEIETLVIDNCVRCHNQNRAIRGIRLDNYAFFVANADRAINRIIRNDLTVPLNQTDIDKFEQWYNEGLAEQ